LDQVRDDMPKKVVNTELVELSDEHRKFYEAIKAGVKEEADKINLNSSNLLALTTRLRQATAYPGILTTSSIESSKIERCVELVEDLVEQGEKVVVMSNFKEPLYQLAKKLEKYNPLVNTGDVADEVISKNVDQFQNDPNSMVFLGTHARVGTGLTLNAAAYLICIDTPFTYSSFAQSCDRIYRVNNTRPAIITVLVGKDTIDERVQEIVETKKDLSDYVVDGKENTLKDELLNIIKNL
jgi:SNF2 family DNA or RNA helicase